MNSKIELNYNEVGKLLVDEKIRNYISSKAQAIANNCGKGYEAETKLHTNYNGSLKNTKRYVGKIEAETIRAKRDNAKNNTLVRSLK